jgi:hypothetical protein
LVDLDSESDDGHLCVAVVNGNNKDYKSIQNLSLENIQNDRDQCKHIMDNLEVFFNKELFQLTVEEIN